MHFLQRVRKRSFFTVLAIRFRERERECVFFFSRSKAWGVHDRVRFAGTGSFSMYCSRMEAVHQNSGGFQGSFGCLFFFLLFLEVF